MGVEWNTKWGEERGPPHLKHSSWNDKTYIHEVKKKNVKQNMRCTSRTGLDLKSEMIVGKMKCITQNPYNHSKRANSEIWNSNLGYQKSRGEIYGTVFKTHILKRKLYLKQIFSQGT